MFIKVSDNPDRYINTDNIESLNFAVSLAGRQTRQIVCEIIFTGGRALQISENAGRALLEFAEANDSILNDYTPEETAAGFKQQAPTPLPLTSRIAQRLRDNAPQGMMILDLVLAFETPGKVVEGELITALDVLIAERVIVFIDEPSPGRYYHVTNAPKATPLDHTQDSSLQSDSAPSAS